MSYRSNDRVSGNRLSSFASQLWEKIKNTFALKNHNHEYIVSGGGASEGAKYFKLFDIKADSKAKPKEINVITRDSADINMSGSLIIRTSQYNKNEVWATFVVDSVKGGNTSAVDENVPFSYSINDNGIISVYGYCDMYASISWSVRCGSLYITPSNTEIESSVYKDGSRFSISLLNDWYSITSKPSTFTPPTASTTTLGGVKVGTNLSIDGNGVLSATDTKYTLTKDAVTALGDLTNNTSGNAAKANNAYYIGSTNNIHAFYTAESGHLCYATINNNGSIQWVKNIAQRDDNGNYDFKGNADTASRVKDLGGTSGNTIGFEYNGSGISKVSPSGNETRANSKYLVALTNDGGNSKYSWVDVNNVSIGGDAATATTANNLNTKTMLLRGGSSVPWYNVVEIGAAFANYRDVTATIGIQLKLRNSSNISSNYFCTANIGCRCNTGTEVLSAFCIVDGQIDLSDKFDLYVTASYYNGNAMVKLFVHVKDTDSNNYYQVNFVTLCKDDFAYSILYNDRSQSSKPTGTKTADAMWYDDIKGNAATATKLTKGYGSATQPIYIKSDGTPEVCTASGISVENAAYAAYASDAKEGSNLENQLNNFVTKNTSQTITGLKTFTYPIIGNLAGTADTATKADNATLADRATLADTANNASSSSFGVIQSGGSYNCLVVSNPANSSQSIQLGYTSNSTNGSRGIWDSVLEKYVIEVKNDGVKFNGAVESAEKWGGYALSLTYTTNSNFICLF